MRLSLPRDPIRRGLTVAIFCSILLHILFLGSFIWLPRLSPFSHAKKGEALFVDLAPDKPAEKAPLGNPSRPPGPPPSPEPAAKAPPVPAPRPRVAAPPPAPAAPPPRPAPPREIAKAPPPAPEPPAKAPPPPAPEPAPAAAPPREPEPAHAPAPPPVETARPETPATGSAPAARSEPSDTHTALARPRPDSPAAGIFRHPGGAGGLQGGRGGTAGEPIPLDTPDPNYREYMQKVRQRIYAKWGYPYEAQTRGLQGKLIIEFHIGKDGRLQFIELKQSSGEEILDGFAMTAVKLAQVYDPLPDAMRRDVLPIVAVFIYTLRGPLSGLQSVQ